MVTVAFISNIQKTGTLLAKICSTLFILIFILEPTLLAQSGDNKNTLPVYLADRGPGMRSSLFATYVSSHEFIVYPFYEYYLDKTYDYNPGEFGYPGFRDYTGSYKSSEGLLFLAYSFNDWFYAEVELAVVKAKLTKSDQDISPLASTVTESGSGDMQSLFNIRWFKETKNRPEIWSYLELDYPFQKNRVISGTQYFESMFGTGFIKGFKFGTFTARAAVEYSDEDKEVVFGEYAFDYLKKISPHVKISVGMESDGGELEAITEVQYHFNRMVFIRCNNAFGINHDAADWAPELGVVISPLHTTN